MGKWRILMDRISPAAWRMTRLGWLGYIVARFAEMLHVTFGEPEWFQRHSRWSLPRGVDWRGRMYLVCWGTAIAVPSLMLWTRGHLPEAILWLGTSSVLFGGDLRRSTQGLGVDPPDSVLGGAAAAKVGSVELRPSRAAAN